MTPETEPTTDTVTSVGDVPVCPGCGLAAHLTHGDICLECFQRREGWQGGGGIRVVPRSPNSDIHETPLCPDFESGVWYQWRDESACYYILSESNDSDYCSTCKLHQLTGFNTTEKAQGET